MEFRRVLFRSRLREVELDAVASRPQYPLDRRKNERIEHQRGDMRRPFEQAAKPLRAAAVEIAFAKGRCREHRIEVAGERERPPDLVVEIGRATSELQSLMRISYAAFCLKKKTKLGRISFTNPINNTHTLITRNIK